MSGIFYKCSSLSEIPDLSKWNFNNVIHMNNLFYGCDSLLFLPDLSTWKINNDITNIDKIFNKFSISSKSSFLDDSDFSNEDRKSISSNNFNNSSLKLICERNNNIHSKNNDSLSNGSSSKGKVLYYNLNDDIFNLNKNTYELYDNFYEI